MFIKSAGKEQAMEAAARAAAEEFPRLAKANTFIQNFGGVMKGIATTSIGAALTSFAVSRMVDRVNNDVARKRLIEDLALNDPILKSVDKKTLLEWYASMCIYAPNLSKDKHTVMEVLHTFARFNKVDLSTLKLLAETEKGVSDASKGSTFTMDHVIHAFGA